MTRETQISPSSEISPEIQPATIAGAETRQGRCRALLHAVGAGFLRSVDVATQPLAVDMTRFNRDGTPRDKENANTESVGLRLS